MPIKILLVVIEQEERSLVVNLYKYTIIANLWKYDQSTRRIMIGVGNVGGWYEVQTVPVTATHRLIKQSRVGTLVVGALEYWGRVEERGICPAIVYSPICWYTPLVSEWNQREHQAIQNTNNQDIEKEQFPPLFIRRSPRFKYICFRHLITFTYLASPFIPIIVEPQQEPSASASRPPTQLEPERVAPPDARRPSRPAQMGGHLFPNRTKAASRWGILVLNLASFAQHTLKCIGFACCRCNLAQRPATGTKYYIDVVLLKRAVDMIGAAYFRHCVINGLSFFGRDSVPNGAW